MKEVIQINGLEKQFGSEQALKDVSLRVNEGEIFGLLGPSGAGKTTAINILTGEMSPSNGEIDVLGYTPDQFYKNHYLKQIGILSDNSALYERITVKDNLRLFQELYEADQSALYDVVKKVGLSDTLSKPVKELSRGMRQRVLLCKCIMHKPSVLFLDEPTSALDPVTSDLIHDLLLQLRDEGTTILLTTHNMDEATLLCDRVGFLNEGVIQELNTPSTLRHKYKRDVVHIYYKNGVAEEIPWNSSDIDNDFAIFSNPEIVHFHADLPELGNVFKKVTGKELK